MGIQAQDQNAPPAPTLVNAIVESSTSIYLEWTVDTNSSVSEQVISESRISWTISDTSTTGSVLVPLNTDSCINIDTYPVTCETTLINLQTDTTYELALAAHGVVYDSNNDVETDYGFGSSADVNRKTHADFSLSESLLAGEEKQKRIPFVEIIDSNDEAITESLDALFTFLSDRGFNSSSSTNPHLWDYTASVTPSGSVKTIVFVDSDGRVEDDLFRIIGTYTESESTEVTVTVTATSRISPAIEASRDVVFTVIRNRPPEFGITAATFEMDENDFETIELAGRYKLSDPDGHSWTYRLENVEPEEETFQIDEKTGAIDLKHGKELDYETSPTYTLHVNAIDSVGDASNTLVLTINVRDIDEPPFVAGTKLGLLKHKNMGFDVDWVNFHVRNDFEDPDSNTDWCYTAEFVTGDDYATISVGGPSSCGLPHVQVRRIDQVGLFEVKEVDVEITATEDTNDDDPATITGTVSASIVYGTNNVPSILGAREPDSTSGYHLTHDANDDQHFDMVFTAVDALPRDDRLCYSLSGQDAAHFKLVEVNNPNEEASCATNGSNSTNGQSSHIHEVRVQSIRTLQRSKSDPTYQFNVIATDLSGQADTLAFEITTDNFWRGLISHPMPDVHLLVDDPSAEIDLLQYFEHEPGTQSNDLEFTIAANSQFVDTIEYEGLLTVSPANSISTDTVKTRITVTAEDDYGDTARESFYLHIKKYNQSPRFERITTEYSIPEDQEVGSHFSRTPSTFDPDGDEVVFRLARNSYPFAADSETGLIAILDRLDFETQASYDLVLIADDRYGGTDSEVVSVTIRDINEPPIPTEEVLPDTETLVGLGLKQTIVGSNQFTDQDANDSLTFEVTSSHRGVATAELDDDGRVVVDGLEPGEATITLRATDSGSPPLTATKRFLLTVEENQKPSLIEQLADFNVNTDASNDMELDGVFEDEPEDIHTYSAQSADTGIATVAVVDSTLTVTGVSEGSVRVTITVFDAADNAAEARLKVHVKTNEPPVLALEFADLETRVGRTTEISLSDHFTDDLDGLTFETTFSDNDVAEADVIETSSTLEITANAVGETVCTVTATDTSGKSVSDKFTISVLERNQPPVVVVELEDIEISLESHVRWDVDIDGVFDDENVDELTYSVEADTDEYADVIFRQKDMVIRLYPLDIGNFEVTVTAEDDIGQTESTSFEVAVLKEAINTAPQVKSPVADQTIHVDEEVDISLSKVFHDPEKDDLTYSAESDDTDIATTEVDDDSLTVTGIAAGTAFITTTATDPSGESVTDTFQVTVKTAPSASQSVAQITLQLGGQGTTVDLLSFFSDADGDPLTFRMVGSDSSIASATMQETIISLLPISRGTASFGVIATDPDGNFAQTTFRVFVSDQAIRNVAEAALGGYGRSLLSSITQAIGSRVAQQRTDTEFGLQQVWSRLSRESRQSQSMNDGENRGTDWLAAVSEPTSISTNGSYVYPSTNIESHLGSAANPSARSSSGFSIPISAWSHFDSSTYAGSGFSGNAGTRIIGADTHAFGSGTWGIALLDSVNESSYSYGTVQERLSTSLRAAMPYFNRQLGKQYSMWGTFGYGRGLAHVESQSEELGSSPLRKQTAVLGLRRSFFRDSSHDLGFQVSAGTLHLRTKGNGPSGGLSATSNQYSVGIDGTTTLTMAPRATVAPFGELGIRYDGGSNKADWGLQMVGGLRVATPIVEIETRATMFRSNSLSDTDQRGYSIRAKYDPSTGGNGMTFELQPSYGCNPSNTSPSFPLAWNNVTQAARHEDCKDQRSLQAVWGFGTIALNDRVQYAPLLSVESSDRGGQAGTLGTRVLIEASDRLAGTLDLQLIRTKRETDPATSEFRLSGTIRF